MFDKNKQIFPWDKRTALTLLSTAAFFLLLFFIDYRWSNTSRSTGEPVAHIVYKRNVVQRKGELDRIWSRLVSNSPLFNRDIIRADHLSDADVFLRDGTQIKIEENSMFRLEFTDKEALISFDRGAIRVLQGDKGTQGLVVRAGGREVELENSNAKIESRGYEGKGGRKSGRAKGELKVSVEKGKAKILGVGKEGEKEYIVGAQERASILSGSKGEDKIQVSKLPVLLSEPSDRQVYASKGGRAKVKFRWKARKKLRQAKLEVSYSRSFRKKLHSLPLPASGEREILFEPGVYYWRVQALGKSSSKRKVESLTYSFEVTRKESLRIFSPENKKVFSYVNRPSTIRFSWSSLKRAVQYKLNFAKDAKLQKEKKSLDLGVSDYSINLEPGTYYWQLGALDQNGAILSKSPLQKFRVQKTNSYVPPKAQAPQPGQKLTQAKLSDGLLFSWDSMEELERFDFQLAKDRRFRNLLSRKSTNDNFVKLRILLGPGTYYWRVRGETNDKKRSRYSPLYSFSVFKEGEEEQAEAEEEQVEVEVEVEEEQAEEVVEEEVDESKPIPKEGWAPPEFGAPEGVRNYTLAQYRKYIAGLTYRCKKLGPPDILVRKCFPTYVYLNLEGWHRLYLFYFLKMDHKNLKNRYQAYGFFAEKCDFQPARELSQFYIQKSPDRSSEEKEKLNKLRNAFQNCRL